MDIRWCPVGGPSIQVSLEKCLVVMSNYCQLLFIIKLYINMVLFIFLTANADRRAVSFTLAE